MKKKEEVIATLLKEAQRALNERKIEVAKKKFDEVMHLSKGSYPWIYFEACFGLVEAFIEEGNYSGAVKCSIRALLNASDEEMFSLGVERLKNVLAIIKKNNKFDLLKGRLEILLPQTSTNRNLHTFVLALDALTKGNAKKAQLLAKDIGSERLKGIIESLIE
ncbi:hypothetical protein OCC_12341 [Thermococcus litoralis DSM 5473]|uniref:Tetratricopeptide repeat protein n=1 Tax=Thermococcus litoralis (strain ATCC 51850 / DSM 5473 / JCM 8560 / NS-C) TaxID=523849 RepID=H3ZNQ6_THELN|nr:hypothetical protein [Thermococcus litoralis]EHR78465.1 hypothetical protein OCC_12341 [Thermococcus litoralis DSM 5473]